MRIPVLPFVVLMLAVSLPALGQSPSLTTSVPVRGAVKEFSGQKLIVKQTDGQTVAVDLPPNVPVFIQVKLTLADLKPDDYLGVGSVKGQDGRLHAVAINVFPESARGTGEGQRGWNGAPNGTMTNAAVAALATVGQSRALTLRYKGGETEVIVDPSTSIQTSAPGNVAMIVQGKTVSLFALKKADGALTANRITVE